MTRSTSSRHPFLAGFAEIERELAQRGPSWLNALRRESADRFEQLDFPTRRLEEWRTTNVARISRGSFLPAPQHRGEKDFQKQVARIFKTKGD